jgi:alpha-amylase/alpha-mannosidase (GH57 family)
MEQSAIDWLLEQDYLITSTKWPELIEKAKAMEKEQIIEAFNSGQAKEASDVFWTKGESYYENIYGRHNQ